MNAERRKRASLVADKLEDLKTELEDIAADETDTRENMPENFREGDKGDEMQSAIDSLVQAAEEIDGVIGTLQDFT